MDVVKAAEYYKAGSIEVPFDVPALSDLVALTETFENEGFSWDEKYAYTKDFRPAPVQFDVGFVDLLVDNEIPQLVRDATGHSDLVLVHCQVRRVMPRPEGVNPSYMDWHRDTYLHPDSQAWVGNTPAVHKLMVYPDHGKRGEERLAILPGSHRMAVEGLSIQAQAQYHMLAGRLMAQEKGIQNGITVVSASNTSALLFNTSMMHSVIPEKHEDGSIRIIYSFATRDQYKAGYAKKEIHRLAYETYELRRDDV